MKFLYLSLILFSLSLNAQTIEELDPNMTLEKADSNGIAWFNPHLAPFTLTGFEWIKQDKVYRRLPLKPEWELRKPVNNLANNTAGGQIHFQTDSPKILVKVELARASGMYHMPATGQSGFDLYLGEPGKKRYISTSRFSAGKASYEVELLKGNGKKNRHVTLNFPLYNGVKSVQVGLVAGSTVKKALPFVLPGPIVVYGTSITQGGCASRPGMAYPNILSRRLNAEFVNLGFSGNGKGEPALAHLINQIENKQLLILDYEANVHDKIKLTLENFINIIRSKNKTLPILVTSKIRYANEIYNEASLKRQKSVAAFQKNLVEKKKSSGDNNIYYLNGGELLGANADECTVDGVHPTDLGFMRMANGIEPVIRGILNIR